MVGLDGHVYTAAWEPTFTDGWHGWWQLGDVTAPAVSYVDVVSRAADHLDIFVVDMDGKIMTSSWDPTGGWQPWTHLNGGFAPPGAPVTAVSRGNGAMDAFVTGTDGRVWTASWQPGLTATWHGWTPISDAKLPLGSYVGAVSRAPDKLDIFATDVDGNVLTAWWEPTFTDGWHGWSAVKGGKTLPGTPVTAVSRRPDFLDVFVYGLDSKPWTASWQPSFQDGWRGWWRIGR